MKGVAAELHGLKHEDDDVRALALIPTLDGRKTYHAKRLWSISKSTGSKGVAAYKTNHPEARDVWVDATVRVSRGKPAGYDDYLTGLAARWLTDDTAMAATNATDVAALNTRFNTSRFNPANHFSKPLGKRTMAKVREAYSARGIPLDAATVKSMSDVRKAAKAARAASQTGVKPFGRIGTISGNQLLSSGRLFPVMQHHGHDSVKILVGGKRVWLRLDVLAAFVEQAGLVAGGCMGEGDPFSNNLLIEDIRDLVPDAETPDFDPLTAAEIGDLVPVSHSGDDLLGEVVPDAPRSLSERLAAAKAQLSPEPPQSTTEPNDPDADPLAF